MGKHTICEAILAGPWRQRDGITDAIIPLRKLLVCGVAHVKIPMLLSRRLHIERSRLNLAQDGDQREFHSGELQQFLRGFYPQATFGNSIVKRVDWEANNWHYDLCAGLTDSETYDIQSSVGPEQRTNPQNQSFTCSIPFPIDWHGPTVTVPWAGEFEGQHVQCPAGYATIFDPHRTWHRGDRWLGAPRGIFMMSMNLSAC